MKTSIIALAFAAITASGIARAADNETTTAATQSVQSDTRCIGAS